MKVHYPSPLTPHLHKPSPPEKRCEERWGRQGKGLRPVAPVATRDNFLGKGSDQEWLLGTLSRKGPKTKSGYLEHFLGKGLRPSVGTWDTF